MKIGIDASFEQTQSNGRKAYISDFLIHFIPLLGRDHHHEIDLFLPEEFSKTVGAEIDFPFNVKRVVLSSPSFWESRWPLMVKPLDILFILSGKIPFFTRAKKIILPVPDLSFHYLAKTDLQIKPFPKRIKKIFQNWFKKIKNQWTIQKATHLIAPSEASKNDLLKFYRCSEKKIAVIPFGAPEVSPLLHWSETERKKLHQQFFLNDRDLFILHVGRLETKKNLVRLVEAFQRFLGEFPGWKLVLAGERGDGFEEIWKKVTALKLEQQVIAPGFISESEKAFLYSHCRLVAFPSLYQSFGIPILEAFAYRRPVLTSKVSGMPEVAGDAAYFVQPEKVEEISVGLKRLVSDGILASKLIQKGETQLKKFSWEQCAQETYNLLS